MGFRVRLGYKEIGSNLVTNGTFNTDLAGWTTDTFGAVAWSQSPLFGGVAVFNSTGGGFGTLKQAGLFTPGKVYRIKWDETSIGVFPTVFRNMAIGDFGGFVEGIIPLDPLTFIFESKQKDKICVEGDVLSLYVTTENVTSVSFDNIEAFELDFNDPLSDEPIGLTDLDITIERDRTIDTLLKKFTSELTFYGDGWDFIDNIRETEGFCGQIPVRIEYECDNGFSELFTGIIYLSRCTFDPVRCEVKCPIDDRNASQLLLNGSTTKIYIKDDPTETNSDLAKSQLPTSSLLINFHDDTGAYPGGVYDNTCYDVFNLIKRIIMGSTDVAMTLESTFLDITFDDLCLALLFSSATPDRYSISFKQIFTQLNNIFNIGIVVTYPSGVPTIKIEDKDSLFGTIPILTLNNVINVKFTYDIENIISAVNIGYKKDVDNFKISSSYEAGTQYVSEEICSQESKNLVSDYIQDSGVIFGILDATFDDQDFGNDYVIVETNGTLTTQFNRLSEGGGEFDYNGDLDPDDNMTRWIETLNISTVRRRDTGELIEKTNDVRVRIFEFDAPLSQTEFDLISDLTDPIAFNFDGTNLEGFILSMTRKIKSGLTSFKLLTT